FFQAEDGIRDFHVTGVQTCALPISAEEAWWARGKAPESVHLRTYPEAPAEWRNEPLAEKWEKIRKVRRAVTGALELERAEKRLEIGRASCRERGEIWEGARAI